MAVDTVLFQIQGGLGKSILSTAVLKVIKKTFPKANIIVITHYPDVFIGNPNTNKVLHPNQAVGLYKKFIENKSAKVFISDPYTQSDYITESNHLLPIWCNMYGLQYDGEQPELFLSKGEKEYFTPFYKLDKPIMAIQPNGGGNDQPLKYSWTRDIPVPVVNEPTKKINIENNFLSKHLLFEDLSTFPYENMNSVFDSGKIIEALKRQK
jgi:hypothetical protein